MRHAVIAMLAFGCSMPAYTGMVSGPYMALVDGDCPDKDVLLATTHLGFKIPRTDGEPIEVVDVLGRSLASVPWEYCGDGEGFAMEAFAMVTEVNADPGQPHHFHLSALTMRPMERGIRPASEAVGELTYAGPAEPWTCDVRVTIGDCGTQCIFPQ